MSCETNGIRRIVVNPLAQGRVAAQQIAKNKNYVQRVIPEHIESRVKAFHMQERGDFTIKLCVHLADYMEFFFQPRR